MAPSRQHPLHGRRLQPASFVEGADAGAEGPAPPAPPAPRRAPFNPDEFDDPLLAFDADPSVFRARVSEARFRLEPEEALMAPAGWREGARVPHALLLNFTLAVRLEGSERLHAAAAEARNPTSRGYGQFLSARAAAELAPANASSLAAVLGWLKDYRVSKPHVRAGGAFVSFGATADTAERMLGCRFWRFHADNGAHALRAYTPYALRADVAVAVDFVAGVLRLPGDGTAPARSWLPLAYATRYAPSGARRGQAAAPPPPMSSAAAREMARERASILRLLEGAARTEVAAAPRRLEERWFGGADADAALEYEELATRVVPRALHLAPAEVVSEPLVEMLAQLAEDEDAPRVWAVPPLNPPAAARRHARRLEVELARLGARGFTLLASTEDASEASARYPACAPHVTRLPRTQLAAVAAMAAAVNAAREGARLGPLGALSGWLPPEEQELACDRGVLLNRSFA